MDIEVASSKEFAWLEKEEKTQIECLAYNCIKFICCVDFFFVFGHETTPEMAGFFCIPVFFTETDHHHQ